jgi:uncharacterized protein
MSRANPISLSERSVILDVLRGFALLGVFLDNSFGFTGWGFLSQQTREAFSTWPADGILGLLELSFVHGKFYSLFSLLFGIGFAIILIRNEQKGVNPLRIFYRRLFILALFGLVHCLFIWEGDILLLYALIGFILPLFRKCSNKTLIIWAVVLVLSPILIDLLKVMFEFKTGDFLDEYARQVDQRTGLSSNDEQYLYRAGSGWDEWRNWQASGIFYRYAYILESNRIPKVLGMFLLGFCIGRNMMYANIGDHRTSLRKLRKWGFIIGIPMSLAGAYFEIDGNEIPNARGLLDTVTYALGVVPLSLAYTATICLWWNRKQGNSKWKYLAPMGQMALTNYLAQSVMAIFLFYGIGLGLGGDIGPVKFIPIILALYAFQVLYSNIWMRYFNYGPIEWIWRQLTYGKRLKLRRTQVNREIIQ